MTKVLDYFVFLASNIICVTDKTVKMETIKIILDAEGLEDQLEQLKDKYQLKLDYSCEANFDGALCCAIIGTTVNIGMFLLQAYTLWGNKRVGLRTDKIEINEMTIKNVIEYLKSQEESQK